MRSNIDARAIKLGEYIVQHRCTVRYAASAFFVSKSTVYKDVTDRLSQCNKLLYYEVRTVLRQNKAERHLRGGLATKAKYESLKQHRKD